MRAACRSTRGCCCHRAASPPPPQLEEDVLRQFLGHTRLVQDAVGRPHHRLIPLPEDRVERGMVAATQAGQHVGVGHVVEWIEREGDVRRS